MWVCHTLLPVILLLLYPGGVVAASWRTTHPRHGSIAFVTYKEALYIKYYRLGLFCNKVNLPNEPYSTINMGDTTTDRLHTTFRYYRISKQCSEVKNMRSNKPGSQWQCESQIWCSRDSWDVHCPDRSVKEIPPVTM